MKIDDKPGQLIELAAQDHGLAAVIRAAREGVTANERCVTIDGVPCTIDPEGMLVVMDDLHKIITRAKPGPHLAEGVSRHGDPQSFTEHINRQKSEHSTIWADPNACKFVAVYDYHGDRASGVRGWGLHRAEYSCPLAPEWVLWTAIAGQRLGQDQFADFVDERMEDLVKLEGDDAIAPADLLLMARNLNIHTKGTFTRQVDPTSGQFALVCKNEHSQESTQIPRAFGAALRVFEGGDRYRVEVRVQFRMAEGRPVFVLSLHRQTEIKDKAFGDVRAKIAADTEIPVFCGTPEAAQ